MSRRRAWWWLALLLGISAVYAVTWANWTWTYTNDRYVQRPPGASATAFNGTELRVLSMKRSAPGSIKSGLSGDLPAGVAEIEVAMEARMLGPVPSDTVFCMEPLVADGRQWEAEYSSFADERPTDCDRDDSDPERRIGPEWRAFTTIYRVPEAYVGQINGIALFHFNGTPADVVRP
ncbi:MAG: hypothetical protein L0G99_12425 [Propionibacteriales bacterium]|nr:hypothetical protein [Propionibacteriales bacterium]